METPRDTSRYLITYATICPHYSALYRRLCTIPIADAGTTHHLRFSLNWDCVGLPNIPAVKDANGLHRHNSFGTNHPVWTNGFKPVEKIFSLNRIGNLSFNEPDYWPPQKRDVNQRSVFFPGRSLHGTAHEQIMMLLRS